MDGRRVRWDGPHRPPIRVAVLEENHIFRRGILVCLERDHDIEVVFEGGSGPIPVDADVAITSEHAATGVACAPPTLICSDTGSAGQRGSVCGNVVAVLPRSELTEDQLGAAVRAAASGLRVDVSPNRPGHPPDRLPERSVQILRLLAMGYGTREISGSVGCSERTVKYAIREAERHLDARSRAQVVAKAIRQGMI